MAGVLEYPFNAAINALDALAGEPIAPDDIVAVGDLIDAQEETGSSAHRHCEK